ncbi:MAG: hypothetical protein KAJ08_12135, partial [Deltaproteobacteria bacterium]|nr:hypothetical protein [Deltaproteobacteria bacterium]
SRASACMNRYMCKGQVLKMEAIQDFEDIHQLQDKHKVRYLIIGVLAFIYQAKPRYTKDMHK